MGDRRARYGAMGGAAMNGRRRALPPLAVGVVTLLTGCKAVPQIVGVVSGAAAGGGTASPAIGFAVGIGTATATGAALDWFGRSRQHAEQEAIATLAGALPVGGQAPWHINHIVPIGNEHGELQVSADIPNPLTACKHIVFSVAEGSGAKAKQSWYAADVCRRPSGWQWASAEPAVPRWGNLQ